MAVSGSIDCGENWRAGCEDLGLMLVLKLDEWCEREHGFRRSPPL